MGNRHEGGGPTRAQTGIHEYTIRTSSLSLVAGVYFGVCAGIPVHGVLTFASRVFPKGFVARSERGMEGGREKDGIETEKRRKGRTAPE